MPHLHAAQRRISPVVPVKAPSTRTPTWVFARASSLDGKKSPARRCPVTWSKRTFMRLLSGLGCARTHAAHRASEGSADPGARVPKWAGPGTAPAGPALGAPRGLAPAEGAAGGDGAAVGSALGVAAGAASWPGETRCSATLPALLPPSPARCTTQAPATEAPATPTTIAPAMAGRPNSHRPPLHN